MVSSMYHKPPGKFPFDEPYPDFVIETDRYNYKVILTYDNNIGVNMFIYSPGESPVIGIPMYDLIGPSIEFDTSD